MSVPKPEPGLADVVGDEEVGALPAELVGRPVERAGLGREPDDDGTWRRGDRARAPTSARMSSVGSSSIVMPSPRASFVDAAVTGRKSATAAAMTSASHGWSMTASMTASRIAAVDSACTTCAASGRATSTPAGDDRDLRAAGECCLRDRDAHLPGAPVADEPDGVDRLRRPAGADDDVAPDEVGVPRRGDERRAGGSIGLADGPFRRRPRRPHRR